MSLGLIRPYSSPEWKAHIESYVSRTNYDEFAFIAMKKNSTHGLTTTAKLYGRNPEVREGLLAEFRQFALDLGIPEDSIFTLKNAGKRSEASLVESGLDCKSQQQQQQYSQRRGMLEYHGIRMH
ncbi:hypothetical protein JD844_005116 [Phrynosoma platyrhinos]|uniref:Lipocalin/cytosolic fatty-acid binding domain-containing protein n=1 Tax=Phrynosoma platyrhinos TaxID=52577 RepID=A0ABQ7SEA1_PHRPL|nr:hypothetical protein JD844_005116 [Phrynosoma platyrhinos]